MKTLKDILYGVSLTELHGDREREISSLAFDSRRVKKGGLFIAIKGLNVDGHDYIETAIDLGAVAILCENLPERERSQ